MVALGQIAVRLVGWWKPEGYAGIANGAAIDTWPDASGNGYDFTSDTATDPIVDATTTLNGYRSVKFTPNVARDSMSAPVVWRPCAKAGSAFWLFSRHTGASAAAGTIGAPAANAQENAAASHWPFSDGKTYARQLRDRNSRSNNHSITWTTGTVYLVEVSSSPDEGWDMRQNGTVVASAGHVWVNNSVSSDVVDEVRIGGNVANGFYGHPANYWEALLYDGVPSSTERSAIHSYFNTKYGLSLPT